MANEIDEIRARFEAEGWLDVNDDDLEVVFAALDARTAERDAAEQDRADLRHELAEERKRHQQAAVDRDDARRALDAKDAELRAAQSERVPDASASESAVEAELHGGGPWLGAARNWLQWNVREGDALPWASTEPVSVPFSRFTDLARAVAIAAIVEERKQRAQEGDQLGKILRLESQLRAVERERDEATRRAADATDLVRRFVKYVREDRAVTPRKTRLARVTEEAARFLEAEPAAPAISSREAARRRMPLGGADAQALEGALAMTERERDELDERLTSAKAALDAALRGVADLESQLTRAKAEGAREALLEAAEESFPVTDADTGETLWAVEERTLRDEAARLAGDETNNGE